MDDAILDTNVIIVASLAAAERVDESHRTPEECSTVFEWLDAFRTSDSTLVLDSGYEIWTEYNRILTGQDFGLLVVMQKMQQCRLHEIEYDPRTAQLEGLYVRRESSERLLGRAKLVRANFVQQIDEHWSKRSLEKNRLATRI